MSYNYNEFKSAKMCGRLVKINDKQLKTLTDSFFHFSIYLTSLTQLPYAVLPSLPHPLFLSHLSTNPRIHIHLLPLLPLLPPHTSPLPILLPHSFSLVTPVSPKLLPLSSSPPS
ncbi:hypothetical protein EGR_05407 [Echinococcus granulosus]|uniref:Uncharacterized protein n=1 Tax=Echinococcus granulosus TaxID=6210 RepID=W6UNF5_ECHGR|nr:hypothetical protein EGR_05407 [Echinococcus granulosus]EUB59787.1 hypothetical protein EGR_05407 [Echinococcus granulosus]